MTKFHVMTLFPEMVLNGLHTSILGRAEENNIISIHAWNIRDYTKDRHKKVDDYPYGGGAGMLMQAQPIYDTYQAILENIHESTRIKNCDIDRNDTPSKTKVIFLSPQGVTFNQKMAKEYAKEENLIFLCGHYEGIDQRVVDKIVTEEVSIGDFVLTGGELPAMVMIDAIARMVPGVLSNESSGIQESFFDNLLEYPQYTRPEIWLDENVPEILLSGNHAKVDEWRLLQAKERTQSKRPDLYEKYLLEHPEVIKPKRVRRKKKKTDI